MVCYVLVESMGGIVDLTSILRSRINNQLSSGNYDRNLVVIMSFELWIIRKTLNKLVLQELWLEKRVVAARNRRSDTSSGLRF